MPTIKRPRRKPRKRKPSSRKKSSSSRKRSRRPVLHPHVNVLSSDEDFVLESADEDSSSDSDGSLASTSGKESEEEEADEEHEILSLNTRIDSNRSTSSRPRKKRRRHPNLNSSDQDFGVDQEEDSTDNESAGQHQENSRSRSTYASGQVGPSRNDDDYVKEVGRTRLRESVSRVARVHHKRHRKKDSSDEDFDMNIDEVLDSSGGANKGTRPVTRAMDAGQVNDFSHLEGTRADEITKSNLKAGETSFNVNNSPPREEDGIDKDTAANKRKGKQKVFEGREFTGSQSALELGVTRHNQEGSTEVVCGICLTETAVVDRGKLDCCDHFFCFGCIMEWAKVESRCPMCKHRFTTVAKAGSGVSKRTRMVRIPLRDQVYIPPDEDLPFEDPYADVVCMECHGTGDEGLLLLCDRCDSAAHTFCVGLGRSVPRGDWYCRDCQALIGESSDSENEAEELVLASESEEEDEECLLRSIVASETLPRRQQRMQRVPVSTSGLPSRSRRSLGTSQRRRLWRHLLSRERRGSRRRVARAPQLSQSSREFLSSITPELNRVAHLSEASQWCAARTVPQQRRLQERITALRNNWGRIQTGDVDFDAVRTQQTGSGHSVVANNGTAAPVSSSTLAAASAVDNTLHREEFSSQGDKDLEQAWRMMSRAQNLSGGFNGDGGQARNLLVGTRTSSSSLDQQSLLSHQGSGQLSLSRSSLTKASTVLNTDSFPSTSKKIDGPANLICSPMLESSRGLKELQEGRVTVSPVLVAKAGGQQKPQHASFPSTKFGEVKKLELPASSSNATPRASDMDCSGNSKDLESIAGCVENILTKRENAAELEGAVPPVMNGGRPFEKTTLGRTSDLPGHATNKEDASHVKDNNVAKLSDEGLKVHLIELVKKQTWPVYISERLGREQFKKIARAAVHALLALFDRKIKSRSFTCSHLDEQSMSPVVNCCNKCLDQHVEDAVKTAKDKVVPH